MDQDARRRIDNARDVLVGKIPDPKAQVEQITSALIYKFMDDMDKDAQGLGGKPSFFTNGYEKYAWSHILDPRLGGQERLNRYAEALSTMSQNPHLPQLFRTIFKDAFLPYRDPTTLNLFLKEINGFTYDHSENLGDAYEYLLSILGSQGDAGQFRTPRHIIDFMVRVVDPKKNETMLDPASGTAGFVISSYRHIIEQNHDHPLTPDEKERLAGNLQGYDIDPNMVRIGLVNMYLHDFPSPRIYEYDTLSSEDRWDEQFDICMANPPFMTPKGGIQPHKKYQVQANRSEVLFVDYIAEHLKSTGRAAVIVPEGIIFQSANAYKALRKMLVETWGLWAVVSLPAGVFHPYSGVKTSILFLEKVFAKKTGEILFVKVQNDGFDLGAQRRPISSNDLPAAQEVLQAWLQGEKWENTLTQWVGKTTIAENGDYNLTGDRYRPIVAVNTQWPMVKLGKICTIESGSREAGGALANGIPSIGGEQIAQDGSIGTGKMRYISEEFFRQMKKGVLRKGDTLLVKDGATTGKTALYGGEFDEAAINEHVYLLRSNGRVLAPLLQRLVQSNAFQSALRPFIKGIIGGISSEIREIEVPLPRLDAQQRIVAELDGYQHIIDGAKQVITNYRPLIVVQPDWPTPTFVDAPFEIIDGDRGANYPKKKDLLPSGYCVFLNTKNVRSDGFNFSELEFISKEKDEALRKGKLRRGDVVLTTRGTIGNTGFFDQSVEFDHIRLNSGMLILRPDTKKLSGSYLFHFFQSRNFQAQRDAMVSGAAQPQLPIRSLNEARIPLPPLATQQAIVAEIDAEQALVAANHELITRFEKKAQTTLARVWGEEDPTTPEK
jgi:type I restriction enzyme M protein